MKPLFSIIIPVRTTTTYLRQTLKELKKQSFKRFEVLVITDLISQSPNPSQKRNIGAQMAKGDILAFIDDDSYPHPDWLKNADRQFDQHPEIAALAGPCLTPPSDDIFRQASGLVWQSYLGSGGAGQYRNSISPPRFVDDYPSVNLFVKKSTFDKLGGFQTHHWPGEDTLFCRSLVHQLNQKIFYHPQIIVFHHRRPVILPHLKQIQRYAIHRGFFFKKYPENSRKIGYLLPSVFSLYLLTLPLTKIFLPLYLYLFLLLATFFKFIFQKNHLSSAFLATITIPLTHLYYGLLFIYGLIIKQLPFSPHRVNRQKGEYLGG